MVGKDEKFSLKRVDVKLYIRKKVKMKWFPISANDWRVFDKDQPFKNCISLIKAIHWALKRADKIKTFKASSHQVWWPNRSENPADSHKIWQIAFIRIITTWGSLDSFQSYFSLIIKSFFFKLKTFLHFIDWKNARKKLFRHLSFNKIYE